MQTTPHSTSVISAAGLILFALVSACAAPGAQSTSAAASAPPVKRIVVAQDASGDFKTMHEAIAAIPDNSTMRTIVHIKPGIYDEGQIVLPETKKRVTFEGEDADKTVLLYHFNQQEPQPGQSRLYTGNGVVILADDFHASNITFKNDSGNHGQAQALRTIADRIVIRNCRLSGWQDTLRMDSLADRVGRLYFKDCFIEGRVDFIYGSATAVFDNCEIHSRNRGHVTAAGTSQEQPFGLVFLKCNLTYDPTPWVDPKDPNRVPISTDPNVTPPDPVDLGRPWRDYATVAYINCEMGAHIKPEGWQTWIGAEQREQTARYYEYKSTGPGANPDKRVPWSHQLTDEQAKAYTIPNILGGDDKWDPTAR